MSNSAPALAKLSVETQATLLELGRRMEQDPRWKDAVGQVVSLGDARSVQKNLPPAKRR